MKYRLFCPALLCVLAVSLASPQTEAAEIDVAARPTVTVTGHGEASMAPDLAYITLGVETQAPQAVDALDDNNRAMQRLIDELSRQGVPAKNVQTSTFNIAPQYRHEDPQRDSQQPQLIGYRVSNLVRVTATDLDGLGALLDTIVRMGANRIHSIQFDIEDADDATDEARKQAIEDARRKAELLATTAGAKIGRPLQIREMTGGYEPPQPMMRMAMARESVPIAQGEQQLAADVTVTYELLVAADDNAENNGTEPHEEDSAE